MVWNANTGEGILAGRRPDREHVTVTIPGGIQADQQLRLGGLGEAGVRNHAAGVPLITVRVKAHDYLHREGNDLHCRATVTIAQAALGVDLSLHGILEENTVAVPAGTQHGDTIRVKGHGMPRPGGSSRRDLIVHVNVEVPRKLTKRQRELLEELATEFGEATAEHKRPLQKLKDRFGA